jgi:HD superfamily phosphohydrolase
MDARLGTAVTMLRVIDMLYGKIELPDWIAPFLRLPEFIRLRGVRLSNVDSIYFKDFAGPTRWEHGIAVASLAYRCATRRGLTERERVQLTIAGLLHDVGTPPFAHTMESVLANFDHELEGERLLSGEATPDGGLSHGPIFQSELPQFRRACERLSKELRVSIDPDDIARCILGEGGLGFLINGQVDLDNADNVTRACLFLGIKIDRAVPLGVADWLAAQEYAVADLSCVDNISVRQWLSYREQLYEMFFNAEATELGRVAFLHYLIRRAIDADIDRSQLIWSTDEDLMATIATLQDVSADDFRPSLKELVQRYRLLESPSCVAKIEIDDPSLVRIIGHPNAVSWITRHLRSERFEPMVLVTSNRFSTPKKTLLPEPAGNLLIFLLGARKSTKSFQHRLSEEVTCLGLKVAANATAEQLLAALIDNWCSTKPWTAQDERRKRNVTAALKSVGDWGFRLSRNDSFHAYPSTFVHALPANILACLGTKEDLVLDPFGGTGQTAVEALKYGNSCVTADSNSIACLIARARLTYLAPEQRHYLRSINSELVCNSLALEKPQFDLVDKWFHPRTLTELMRIAGFISTHASDGPTQTFLQACMSAILPSCTARRGEQHGYFADNCPLPKGTPVPKYQAAVKLFIDKVQQALDRAERLYGFIERQGRKPDEELSRVTVRQVDVRLGSPEAYGVEEGSVAAIVTSPPYLCMADYSLGLRLSYAFLSPETLTRDFAYELGARRLRLSSKSVAVISGYHDGLEAFAKVSAKLLRKGGFLAVVLGQPVSERYRDVPVMTQFDDALKQNGFEPLWHTYRNIHWHRNHGYARLKKERISVHVRS